MGEKNSFSGAVKVEASRQAGFLFTDIEHATGIILDKDGHVAVPAHAVYGANEITIEADFPKIGHRTFKAETIKADVENDVAIVQLKSYKDGLLDKPFVVGSIPVPVFTDSQTVAEGQEITACGYPLAKPTLRPGDKLRAESSGLKEAHGKISGLESNAKMLGEYIRILTCHVKAGRGDEVRDESGATNKSELTWATESLDHLNARAGVSYYAEYDQQEGMSGAVISTGSGIFGMAIRSFGAVDAVSEQDPNNPNLVSIVPIETIKHVASSADPSYRYDANVARQKLASGSLSFQHVPSLGPKLFKELTQVDPTSKKSPEEQRREQELREQLRKL